MFLSAVFLAAFAPTPALRPACLGCERASLSAVRLQISSPFDSGSDITTTAEKDKDSSSSSTATTGPLELNLENVESVLDTMRPYLMADGGNVAVTSIDDGIVKLELQGACGSCPSSTMTMKMGLERGLLERIPGIVSVEQVAPSGPQLTEEGIEEVLDEIRPFLKMAGGSCDLVSLDAEGVQPVAKLAITGSGSTINSVRVEIAQRLKRNVRCNARARLSPIMHRLTALIAWNAVSDARERRLRLGMMRCPRGCFSMGSPCLCEGWRIP